MAKQQTTEHAMETEKFLILCVHCLEKMGTFYGQPLKVLKVAKAVEGKMNIDVNFDNQTLKVWMECPVCKANVTVGEYSE